MVPDVAIKQDGCPTFAFDTDVVVHKGIHELRDSLSFPGFRTLSRRVRAEPDFCEQTGSLLSGLIGREIFWCPEDHSAGRRTSASRARSIFNDPG
jgi:hypothetical protein